MTVFGLDILFDHPPRLPSLSDQAVNVFSTDDFAPDPRFCSLSYHPYRLCPSLHQAVNVFSMGKPTERRSCSTPLSTFSQTTIGADTPQSHLAIPIFYVTASIWLIA